MVLLLTFTKSHYKENIFTVEGEASKKLEPVSVNLNFSLDFHVLKF